MSIQTGQPPGPSSGRRRLPKWKKLVFSLIVTVFVFAVLEGALALVGVRPLLETEDPFVGFADNVPLFVERDDEDGRVWMATAENKLAWFNEQRFLQTKPKGAFRIVCLGGSTTYGRPYDDLTSFPGWLRELLPLAEPDRTWEVINAGGISYASYRVAALVEELAAYEPDLLVIYTGHNEFLEQRTYGDLLASSPTSRQWRAALLRSRTYTLLSRLLKPSPTKERQKFQLPGEVDEILSHTVGPKSYHRDDELQQQILTHFEFNLRRMVAIARRCGAQVLFIVPACNLKDCAPFKSEHRGDLTAEPLRHWESLLQQAMQFEDAGDLEQALSILAQAEQLDDRHAALHYRKGRVLFLQQRFAEATAAFTRARDEDICPLRALGDISDALRRTAGQLDVPLIDFEQQLRNQCLRNYGHNAPGKEFFFDHVHLKTPVNRMLAVSIVKAMASAGWLAPGASFSDEQLADVTARVESRIDSRAHAAALRNLAKVLNWAGKHHEAGLLALEALKTLPDDPEALLLAAAYLQDMGQIEEAIEYYRAALRTHPDPAEVHRLLAAALVLCNRFEEALPHCQEAARLRADDADGQYYLGRLELELGQRDAAIAHLRQALKLDPQHAAARKTLRGLSSQQAP